MGLDGVGGAQVDAAAHHQVQDQYAVAQAQQQVLSAAVDSLDALADETKFKLVDRDSKGEFGVQDGGATYGSVYDIGIQLAADRFYLWQLRHNRETMGWGVRRAPQHANRNRPVKSPGR